MVDALRFATVTCMHEVVVTVVLLMVNACVPAAAVVKPVNVATPNLLLAVTAAVGEAVELVAGVQEILPVVGTMTIPPEPPLMVVVDVVFVEPTVSVLAAAPVPTLTVVAAASLEMFSAPVPIASDIAPFVEVTFKAPEPD